MAETLTSQDKLYTINFVQVLIIPKWSRFLLFISYVIKE